MNIFKLPQAEDVLPPQGGIYRYFFVQRLCFTAIGINPTSLKQTIFNRFLTFLPMMCTMTLCGPMAMMGSKYTHDLNKMANAVAPMWQGVLAIAKFILFMWNKEKIVGMIRYVWLSNLKVSERELRILSEENHYERRISSFYYSMALISSLLLIFSPTFIAGFYAWHGHGFWQSLDLPYKAVYFWDPHTSITAYIANYVWNVLCVYFIFNASLGVDTLFSWFMRNISAQFRMLNLRFVLTASSHHGRGTEKDIEFDKSIIECIKYHRHVLELAKSFSEVYKQLVFVKFLIGCVQISFLTFQLSRGGDVTLMVFNICFFITVATQLMLYCHGGQKIMDLSISVGTTIYDAFKWHELSVKSKKLLLITMMRTTKPCNVTGIFFVADFALFLWVYRAAGSFMTMMLSMEPK